MTIPTDEQWTKLSAREQEIGRYAFEHPEMRNTDLADHFGMRIQGIGFHFDNMRKKAEIVPPQRQNLRRGRQPGASAKVKRVRETREFGPLVVADRLIDRCIEQAAELKALRVEVHRIPDLEEQTRRHKEGEETWMRRYNELQQKGGLPGLARLDSGWLEDLDPYVARVVRTIADYSRQPSKRNFPPSVTIIPNTIPVPAPILCYS